MYLNSKSFEKKYLKYKNKYLTLKKQLGGAKGTLHGGDCHPLPDEEDVDVDYINDEDNLISFLNEYYVVYPKKIPKAEYK